MALATTAQIQAADVFMTANDANGAVTSFNGAGFWNPAGAPVVGNSYFNSTFLLRTPAVAGNVTFGGGSLTITGTPAYNSLQAILFKGTATSTVTINNLTINGGNLRTASGDTVGCTYAGNGLAIGPNGAGVQVQGPTYITAPISGTSFIKIFNSEAAVTSRTLHIASSANTFTGNLELADATRARVDLNTGANFKFAIGANGVNNKIFGLGLVAFNGTFNLDLSGAGTTVGNTWPIVAASTLTETYGAGFTLTGFTSDSATAGSRLWTYNNAGVFYQFSEVTGNLTVVNPDTDGDGLADGWETSNFGNLGELGTGDFDGDGATNEQEETAGTNPKLSTSWPDVDADSLKDAWELTYFGNLTAQNAAGDADGDLASNLSEFVNETFPDNRESWPDVDGDFMNDGWETVFFGNLSKDGTADSDGDTYTDAGEHDAHTNPSVATGTRVSPVWSTLKNRWSFNGNLTDSVGGSNATVVDVGANNVTYNDIVSPTGITMSGGLRTASDYISLGSNLMPKSTTPVTLEFWVKQNSIQNWARIFDFHSGPNEALMMAWTQAANNATDRFEFTDAGSYLTIDNKNQPWGIVNEHHIVVTLEPLAGAVGNTRVTFYSAPTGSATLGAAKATGETPLTLVNFVDTLDALGYSPFTGDNTANATYNEVRIWNGALNSWSREKLHQQGADNAALPDADNDFIPDDWEITYFGNTSTLISALADNDSDTISNRDEFLAGSNPSNIQSTPADIDGDGLEDAWEVLHFGNIAAMDGSGNPDNDSFTNEEEETNSTNPNSNDNDLDLLTDSWEISFFGNTTSQDGFGDPDGDTFNNDAEETAGSNPTIAASVPSDTDGDGLLDTWEVANFGNLTVQNGLGNPDGDLYTNEQEETGKSNPNLASSIPGDINGDAIADGHLLVLSDPAGTASFNSGAGWDDLLAPVSGSNYLVSINNFRTPADAADYTFLGDKLVITTGGNIVFKGTGVITLPYLGLDGGLLNNATNTNVAITLGGAFNVSRTSEIWANNNSIIVNASIAGTKDLNITRSGLTNTVTFNAANTWTGNLNVTGGFVLGSTGSLTFIPTLNGVSNGVVGAGTATFNGAFNINLTNASGTPGNSWTLVNAGTLTETYGASFVVTGFTPDAGVIGVRKWTSASGIYQFDEATGILTSLAPTSNDSDGDGMPDDWETTYFGGQSQNASADFDSDGTNNLTEYRLNLIPNSSVSRFAATRNAAGLLQWPSAVGVTFTVKRSTTLQAGSWTSIGTITGTAGTASFTDPSPPAGRAFYQILLEP